MNHSRAILPAEIWLQQMFEAKAARQGTIIRRKRRDIERSVGWERFEREILRRGYQAVENSGQIIIFCNCEPIRRVV